MSWEKRLAKHVKGVREKKIKRGKERTFHKLSPSIISALAFQPWTTLSPITRSTRNEKYKRGRRRRTKLNYPKLQQGKKTTQLSVYPSLEPQGVFIGTRGKGARGTTPGPKYGRGRARMAVKMRPKSPSVAVPERRAQHRLLRAASLSLYRLHVPVSSFGPLVLIGEKSRTKSVYFEIKI